MSNKGYVYILVNENVPSLVKIGFTNRDPKTRAIELSNVTGVPGEWIVKKSWHIHGKHPLSTVIDSLMFDDSASVLV